MGPNGQYLWVPIQVISHCLLMMTCTLSVTVKYKIIRAKYTYCTHFNDIIIKTILPKSQLKNFADRKTLSNPSMNLIILIFLVNSD